MTSVRVPLVQQPALWAMRRDLNTVELHGAPLAAFRQRFPAHWDADRFILDP